MLNKKTPLPTRIPAPDLARGFMLLLIVLANTPYYLYGRESGSGAHPVDGSIADKAVQAVLITAVDLRVYPMFAFLFGYGLVMIMRRQRERGLSDAAARKLVQRRNLLLIAFGAVHALLLWGGDVLGAYGLCGLLLVWLFMRRSDRTLLVYQGRGGRQGLRPANPLAYQGRGGRQGLRPGNPLAYQGRGGRQGLRPGNPLVWAGIGTGLLILVAALSGLEAVAVLAGEDVGSFDPDITGLVAASVSTENVVAAAVARMTMWPIQVLAIQGPLGLVVPVSILLGFWAARRQVLERPDQHRRLLWSTAIVGIAIGWSAGLVHALTHIGVLDGLRPVLSTFAAPQMVTGLACGLGYVAVFGLIGDRVADRPLGTLGGAVSAVGKRSMTSYLAQSVLCAPLLAAWGLGLGGYLGSATMAAFAVGVWLITVGYAVVLERRGKPGPAEALIRRMTYGSAGFERADHTANGAAR